VQRQGSIGGSAAIRIRATGILLLAAHLVFVAWVSLRPLNVPWVMPANLHPFDGIRADLRLGWPEAASRIGTGLGLFAPLGFLLPLVHGRLRVSPLASLVRTVTAGALLSLAVELLQTGVPGQVADVDSMLLTRSAWPWRTSRWCRRSAAGCAAGRSPGGVPGSGRGRRLRVAPRGFPGSVSPRRATLRPLRHRSVVVMGSSRKGRLRRTLTKSRRCPASPAPPTAA